ncbi:MAG TPA: hypothetical protein VJH22_00630 [Candidatus Nanoarchaeia archaeon]|nr:hypothetical protein [Candidatus Nanoarchaeia archaeon]
MSMEEPLRMIAEVMRAMSDEELNALLSLAHSERRVRETRISQLKLLSFKPGDVVKNLKDALKLPLGARGTIIRIAKTTMLVNFGEAGEWRMPPELLEKEAESIR